MATPKITSAVHNSHTYAIGDRVCVTGIGTDAPAHSHGYVKRFTATQMVVECHIRRNGETVSTFERKYWTDRAYGREVGAFEWGGTHPHPTCTRPKKG